MAVKWTCDFPSCGETSSDHKGWERWELFMSKWGWLAMAIPIIGTICCLTLFGEIGVRHYCPNHSLFLAGGKRKEVEL